MVSIDDRVVQTLDMIEVLESMTSRNDPYLPIASRVACLSESQALRVFKIGTGMTMITYLRNRIASRCAELLVTTNYSMKFLSDMLDYRHQTSMGRCFKYVYGITPLEFRKTQTEKTLGEFTLGGITAEDLFVAFEKAGYKEVEE